MPWHQLSASWFKEPQNLFTLLKVTYCTLSSHLPLAPSNWDAEFWFTLAMRGNRSAATELELTRGAGLCWDHPWGCYCGSAHIHTCSKLVTCNYGKTSSSSDCTTALASFVKTFALAQRKQPLNAQTHSMDSNTEALTNNPMAGAWTISQGKTIWSMYLIGTICATWYSTFKKQWRLLDTDPVHSRKGNVY